MLENFSRYLIMKSKKHITQQQECIAEKQKVNTILEDT